MGDDGRLGEAEREGFDEVESTDPARSWLNSPAAERPCELRQ
jgi:hypothetical protein